MIKSLIILITIFQKLIFSRMPGKTSKRASAAKAKVSRKAPVTASKRADLVFPVGRVCRLLKQGKYASAVGKGAGVFAAAVMEYIAIEILELAGNAAEEHKKKTITPRHIQLAIRNDEEITKLFAMTTIASGGVLPNVQAFCFPNKGAKKAADGAAATQEL